MDGRVRIYSVAEANAVLAKVNPLLGRQIDQVVSIERAVERLRTQLGPEGTPDLRTHSTDTPQVAESKSAVRRIIAAFRATTDEIEATGAVIKDVRTGLIDFYGQREGRLVWLCFRYGERAIEYWHPLHLGFSARKPIAEAAQRWLN